MGFDRYDVIIVGAGPAGSSAALLCTQNNLSVALIERGKYPGSKNMFGGTIYRQATEMIIPDFWDEAPIERFIINNTGWFMEPSSFVEMGFTSYTFGKPPYNIFSVIRSRFDRWFASKAEQAGAHLMTSTLVEDLLYENVGLLKKKVGGVILEDGSKLYSDVVILAEGAQADLTGKAGMRRKIDSTMVTVYVKELLALPREVIEARFNLEKDEGAVIGMIGFPTAGAIGKGGIWTNQDTLSITVGAYLNQMIKKGLNPYQLLSRLKQHPGVKRLITGAKAVQYQSAIIPKGGYRSIPELYSDGILITGNAAMLIAGRHGTDIAMLSGKYAAETVIQAKAKGDFSKTALSSYNEKIKNSFFLKGMRMGKAAGKYYKEHSDSDFLFSQALNEIAYEFFTESVDTQPEKLKRLINEIKRIQGVPKTIEDLYEGFINWRYF